MPREGGARAASRGGEGLRRPRTGKEGGGGTARVSLRQTSQTRSPGERHRPPPHACCAPGPSLRSSHIPSALTAAAHPLCGSAYVSLARPSPQGMACICDRLNLDRSPPSLWPSLLEPLEQPVDRADARPHELPLTERGGGGQRSKGVRDGEDEDEIERGGRGRGGERSVVGRQRGCADERAPKTSADAPARARARRPSPRASPRRPSCSTVARQGQQSVQVVSATRSGKGWVGQQSRARDAPRGCRRAACP